MREGQSEEVEVVARAIYEAFNGVNLSGGHVSDYRFGEWGETTLDGKWDLDRIAQAAIDALDACRRS